MTTDEAVALFAPLKKTMHLKVSVAQAFARFAEHFGDWWPRQSGHCVFGDASTGCLMEPGVGGRILETGEGDQTTEWGRVVLWEPPHRLSFDWYPGRTADTSQRIDLSFTADSEGTRIDLTHNDWHLLGDRADELRQSYDGGWDQVLGTFGAHASRASARARYENEPRGRIAAFQTTINAPVETVWELLATEEGVNRWFTDESTLEGQVGGALVFRWRELANDGGTMELYGRVVQYDPGACFVFDWQADSGTYDLRCQIEFEVAGDGTVVRLNEQGFQNTPRGLQDLLNRQSGWSQQLTRLKVFAEHGIRV